MTLSSKILHFPSKVNLEFIYTWNIVKVYLQIYTLHYTVGEALGMRPNFELHIETMVADILLEVG